MKNKVPNGGINKGKIKAIFFDMDGTLYDSMPFHSETLVLAFKEIDVQFHPRDAYLNEGRPTPQIVNQVLNREAEDWEQKTIQQFIRQYQSTASSMPIVSGMKEVVAWCKEHGIVLFLVTGSPRDSKILQHIQLDFPDTFPPERIITGDEVAFGKPHPEPYLKALEISGVNASEALVIENAPLGITAGKAAGIFTIAINTGILHSDDLQHADELFLTVPELFHFIKDKS